MVNNLKLIGIKRKLKILRSNAKGLTAPLIHEIFKLGYPCSMQPWWKLTFENREVLICNNMWSLLNHGPSSAVILYLLLNEFWIGFFDRPTIPATGQFFDDCLLLHYFGERNYQHGLLLLWIFANYNYLNSTNFPHPWIRPPPDHP